MAGTLGPSADPTPRPDHGVGRIIAVSILIMTVVILWAAWGVASLSNWPG
jgi:ABC-type Na+ efflux pump permease subunit